MITRTKLFAVSSIAIPTEAFEERRICLEATSSPTPSCVVVTEKPVGGVLGKAAFVAAPERVFVIVTTLVAATAEK